jgi:hypothetical protein
MRRDLHNWLNDSQNINIQTINSTTPVEGAIVDTQGFSALEFVISSAAITTGIFTPSFEWGNESDLSDAVAVDADHILGEISDATFGTSDDNVSKRIGVYLTTFRYVRLIITGSSTPNGVLGAVALLSAPYLMPTAA